jgi:hypothetical protein
LSPGAGPARDCGTVGFVTQASGNPQGVVSVLLTDAGILCVRVNQRRGNTMTTQRRTMPGFVGYLSILLIFASVIGPALI